MEEYDDVSSEHQESFDDEQFEQDELEANTPQPDTPVKKSKGKARCQHAPTPLDSFEGDDELQHDIPEAQGKMYYRHASSSLDSDDDEPPSKKAKKPEPVILQVIVLIPKEVVARPGTRKPASSSKFNIANFVQKNPFKFGSTDKYSVFLGGIASVMDCSVDLLRPTKLQYKMKTPATSPILAMGSEIAFKELIDEVVSKIAVLGLKSA
ncbi:hypothetical protein BDP27DRAFT_1437748 [Rhodocollybia butyracea]|uniref:Uncharacterized protein n=1 Tax=Rhodocollybia butyracea TaxID=206335 RepID=A0A9P5TWQ6_9AGAR|nr:hypothetical protein BDP27DRAFT_1437748 [Rhodocollybia butyracea]